MTTLAEALGINHPQAEYERANFWKGSIPPHTPIPIHPDDIAKVHTIDYTDQIISNPPHYTAGRVHEPIDVISDWGLDFCLGNVVKYISRAGRKDDILQDLKKARFYLDYKISLLESKSK